VTLESFLRPPREINFKTDGSSVALLCPVRFCSFGTIRQSQAKVPGMGSKRLLQALLTATLLMRDMNLLPKYGSQPKSEALKAAADESFISGMDKDYHGHRAKASMDIATRGWQFLAAGDFNTAMQLFNQADFATVIWPSVNAEEEGDDEREVWGTRLGNRHSSWPVACP